MFANCRSLGINACSSKEMRTVSAARVRFFLNREAGPRVNSMITFALTKIRNRTQITKRGVGGGRRACTQLLLPRTSGAFAPGFVLSGHVYGQIEPC